MNIKNFIPNTLTISRGIGIVIICILVYSPTPFKFPLVYSIFLFCIASDYFDGMLARLWKVKSNFGIVFDSLFDKILTICMYILLVPFNLIHPSIFVALIFRDLFIDGLKNYSLSSGKPISSKFSGKLKMVFQSLLINFALLLLIFPNNHLLTNLLWISSTLALLFSYYSGLLYVYDWSKNKR